MKDFQRRIELEILVTEREAIVAGIKGMDNCDAIYPETSYQTARAELKAVEVKLQQLAEQETGSLAHSFTNAEWEFLVELARVRIISSPANSMSDRLCDRFAKAGLIRSIGGREWMLTDKVKLTVEVLP